MASQQFPAANQEPPNYNQERSDESQFLAPKKQQELVCVIPAITKNQDESRRLRTISKGGEATKRKSYDTRRTAKAPLTAYAPKKDLQRRQDETTSHKNK